MKIRIATRRSRLALTQTRMVVSQLRAVVPEIDCEEVEIETEGDRILDRPLAAVGGKGLFVSEVQAALVDGRADVAVHSLKDIPGDVEPPPGLELVCLPMRLEPRDVLLTADGGDIYSLRAGAVVGTTSARRSCQLKQVRPDLQFKTLRGNVETRLRRLQTGDFDAIVLAAAGLLRLGLDQLPQWMIPVEVCIPAVGQGTLAVQARRADTAIVASLAALEDPTTRVVSEAERALLMRLRGNCHVAIGGFAQLNHAEQRLQLQGMVGSYDGMRVLSATADRYVQGLDAAALQRAARELGTQVAEGLIDQGADKLMLEAETAGQRQAKTGNGSGAKEPWQRR